MHMFPTFLSFTQRHPRAVAVIGLNLFIISVVLFITTNQSRNEIQNPIVEQSALPQDEIIRGDTFSHDYKYKYGFENTTFDTDGYIREINIDSITIEDTTPRTELGAATHELVTIKFASNCIFARGHEIITVNDIKVGESVFLVTTSENGILTAQEIFAQPSTVSTDITN